MPGREFRRIVKADGFVALIWNERDKTESVFAREYEELLLQYGTDYKEVDHSRTGMEKARVFWQGAEVTLSVYPNAQLLDRTARHGRVDSSSYVPHAGKGTRGVARGIGWAFLLSPEGLV